MSVFCENWPANTTFTHDGGCVALFLQTGQLKHNGQVLDATSGIYPAAGDQVTALTAVVLLRFTVTPGNGAKTIEQTQTEQMQAEQTPIELPQIEQSSILSSHINTELSRAILRLDQVDFPPAAVAYRHTHPGAGIRYLVHGNLHIQSDHAEQQMNEGQAWFEDADSPVRATAGSNAPSCFVRLMLLPMEFEGKPTLKILDPDDAAKPRLQTNTRYFDQRVELSHLG